VSAQLSRIIGIAACGVAGVAGAAACLYATDHRTSYLILAVVAAVVTVAIIGVSAIATRRAGNDRAETGMADDDTTTTSS
jgi:hypothetical protein